MVALSLLHMPSSHRAAQRVTPSNSAKNMATPARIAVPGRAPSRSILAARLQHVRAFEISLETEAYLTAERGGFPSGGAGYGDARRHWDHAIDGHSSAQGL